MTSEQNAFRLFAARLLPRILTQIARDVQVPLSGSCDRNYWHYKIRDFSSSILQQAGYSVWSATGIVDYPVESLARIGAESCRFWNRRAQMFRAFEEYYPWESGYPPVAFSTLAVAKMIGAGLVPREELSAGFKVAARQLVERFEPKATNQQVAGMAALCWVRKLYPEFVTAGELESVVARSLACQQDEGWYMEYGGPDLGYLSVTMDCLWDAFDATGDERFVDSAARALDFITQFVLLSPRGIGMHNARNTDYIVPYGIARFLEAGDAERAVAAAEVLRRLYGKLDEPGHFLNAVDDRYWCHYIGASFFRAIPLMEHLLAESPTGRSDTARPDVYVERTGHWLRYRAEPFRALVSAKKGGIVTFYDSQGRTFSDFGWTVALDGAVWTNHWWDNDWRVEREGEDFIRISGHFSRHAYLKNTPFRHMVLRMLSFAFGNRIIAFLKQKMIFKAGRRSGPEFVREIVFNRADGTVVVRDRFALPPGADERAVSRAPRASQRHVASADSFHYEDFDVAEKDVGISRDERTSCSDGYFKAETTYRAKEGVWA